MKARRKHCIMTLNDSECFDIERVEVADEEINNYNANVMVYCCVNGKLNKSLRIMINGYFKKRYPCYECSMSRFCYFKDYSFKTKPLLLFGEV